jgi:hypothetical protein
MSLSGADLVTRFLASAGWSGASTEAVAGDASTRRYMRLTKGAHTAILMLAPPDDGTTERFAHVGAWLRDRGYSAPDVLAHDPREGLMLCEDLGTARFAETLRDAPETAGALYSAAVDFLADIARHPVPAFAAPLDGPALAGLLDVVGDWYLPAMGQTARPLGHLAEAVATAHAGSGGAPSTLSLRDFHVENLIWLPHRAGHARVGLLDFQDAVAADPAYDMVSLLQDARRDVPLELERAMLARRWPETGGKEQPPRLYAVLGAQRALRILGVFARLALRDRRSGYLAHVPRVWSCLLRNLSHPGLAQIAQIVRRDVPEPRPEHLNRLKAYAAGS